MPDGVLQGIAAENNLSETAFVIAKGGHFALRWFTPKVEVDLCGRATLAAAFVIFKYLGYTGSSIRFQSKSGLFTVERDKELNSGFSGPTAGTLSDTSTTGPRIKSPAYRSKTFERLFCRL
ncbi:MAG: PhzF family phenazine biosynthesis protein [Bacillota bacterium]